jgi:hypothetical protein
LRQPDFPIWKQETTEFDASHACAVFFKLPCLKLFDHDKIISAAKSWLIQG